ncbi:hypothetical protein Gogos_015636, partial [Gossypium gossypioides]|nr:hypothetical protein [Gossypium gossypioides]
VAYHFEKEIEDALEVIYDHYCNHIQIDDGEDLYTTAVRFRLLREHGFNVQCAETFNKFKNVKGKFKESLISDVKGMLELYEAAHFQLHEENLLEEALSFTTFHLKLAETTVDYPLSTQIAYALKRPLRKSLPRLVAWSYISIYEGYGTQDKNLMKFAKLDFKMVQHLHMKEISEIYRWWKGLDVETNFPFIRDRLVECYLWILGVYFEPHYSVARTFMTKVISLTSIVDDTYDAYATYEELEIFTKAIQREHVPSAVECYMKQYGVSAQEAYDEFYKRIKNAWKDMNEAFLKPTVVPTSALNRILNLTRVIDLLYKDEDAYTRVGDSAKTSITALLIDPISI